MTGETPTATTIDVASTVKTYFEAWNEPDAGKRAPLIAAAWADDGCLIDPPFEAEGHEAIVAAMSSVREQYPGYRLRQASQVDTHHDQLRYTWELVAPDGTVALGGIDVGAFAPDGRLQRVTGFWGEPEPLG